MQIKFREKNLLLNKDKYKHFKYCIFFIVIEDLKLKVSKQLTFLLMATSHSLYETAGVIEKYDNLKNVGFGLNQKMDMTTFKFWKSLTEEGCCL